MAGLRWCSALKPGPFHFCLVEVSTQGDFFAFALGVPAVVVVTDPRFSALALVASPDHSWGYLRCSLALFGYERLLSVPELLEQPQWAAESAAWFWSVNGLNALADQEQFNTITRRINGGLNGLEDRLQLWARARAVLCVSST